MSIGLPTRGRRDTSRENRAVAGKPPEPGTLWARLESPLSTYYMLIAVVGLLLTIGLVMVLSASSVSQLRSTDSSFSLFYRQAAFAVMGIVGAAVASRMPIVFWRRIAVPVLLVAVVLQLLVFSPLGYAVGGNRNWLAIGGLPMQPSEVGKIALVIFTASVLATKRRLLHEWQHVLIPALVPVGLTVIGLVLVGRDLGTALVLIASLAGMLWVAGVSWKLFGIAAAIGGAGVAYLVTASGNRMDRINQWLSCTDVHQCWQSRHGQFALADGGLWGLGLGGSREKWAWLPEAHNDFIFAIIGEELGIAGTLMILTLFALFALACYRIILRTDDMFVRVATAGVMVWITSQAVINIGSVIGLLPVIGVPLPLVSYGGSALVTTLGALGMVISFARREPAARKALEARPRMSQRALAYAPKRRKK
ncbi:MAG: putative lipid II flippase FtsW [Dermatophilus congolensis]|nr:putative lipid II flippase FtsW [Dermatophilus congolensis]